MLFKKVGRIVTEANADILAEGELMEWQQAAGKCNGLLSKVMSRIFGRV